MSHPNVERVIGRLVTDEAFRHRFSEDPRAAIAELSDLGVELTACELQALISIDPRHLARFAVAIDPRIQKTDLKGGSR